MTATTKDRSTLEKRFERFIGPIPLTASTKIPRGVMAMVIAGTGTLQNAADTASGIVMGVTLQAFDSNAPQSDTVGIVARGAYWMANDGTIAAADIGGAATVLDNQTVSKAATTTNDIVAGYIEDVDATRGVLIAFLGGKVGAT